MLQVLLFGVGNIFLPSASASFVRWPGGNPYGELYMLALRPQATVAKPVLDYLLFSQMDPLHMKDPTRICIFWNMKDRNGRIFVGEVGGNIEILKSYQNIFI